MSILLGNHEGSISSDSMVWGLHTDRWVKVKGFQVAPAELEGCLLDHPDVSNTCVVGVPDEYRACN